MNVSNALPVHSSVNLNFGKRAVEDLSKRRMAELTAAVIKTIKAVLGTISLRPGAQRTIMEAVAATDQGKEWFSHLSDTNQIELEQSVVARTMRDIHGAVSSRRMLCPHPAHAHLTPCAHSQITGNDQRSALQRLILLSYVAPLYKRDAVAAFFGCSIHMVNQARRHAKENGVGAITAVVKYPRPQRTLNAGLERVFLFICNMENLHRLPGMHGSIRSEAETHVGE